MGVALEIVVYLVVGLAAMMLGYLIIDIIHPADFRIVNVHYLLLFRVLPVIFLSIPERVHQHSLPSRSYI